MRMLTANAGDVLGIMTANKRTAKVGYFSDLPIWS